METQLRAESSRFVRPRRELIPVVVLLTAALVFAVAVRTQDLTTWTGPGFSMFSTVDYDRTRWVRVEVTTPEGVAPAEQPESADALLEALKHRPNAARAEELANAYLRTTWVWSGDRLVPGTGPVADSVRLALVNVYVSDDEIVSREILRVEVEQ